MLSKPLFSLLALLSLGGGALLAQDAPSAEDAANEAELAKIFGAGTAPEPKHPGLDRTRGQIVFKAADQHYSKGGHFGKWSWGQFTPERWGRYQVNVTQASQGAKMGFQFYVGESKAKGYVAQSGSMDHASTETLGTVYIPTTGPHNVGALTGDDSNGSSFKLREVTLIPAPEGEPSMQGIDGSIVLAAKEAATFSQKMRYEPKPEKNCLGFWTDKEDWAEWRFTVHDAGKFQMEIFYGCASGNEGSEVSVWLNDKEMTFKVADTGGFQSWKSQNLGTLEIGEGKQIVTVKPKTKVGAAVMDVQKIVLTPAQG